MKASSPVLISTASYKSAGNIEIVDISTGSILTERVYNFAAVWYVLVQVL